MNEHKKSLKLAELMEWEVKYLNIYDESEAFVFTAIPERGSRAKYFTGLNPYNATDVGLAQFAAILLKFPEVFPERLESYVGFEGWFKKPTQANILDEILAMSGVEI